MNSEFGVEYHIVDSCNLRCAGCCHYSSLLDELTYIPLSKMSHEFRLLASKTCSGSELKWLRLLGGEPLLHPEIVECLHLARKFFPESDISIVTNGLKLNSMEESFFKECGRLNIGVQITDYGLINLPELFARMKDLGCRGELYQTCRTWYYQSIRLTGGDHECYDNCRNRIYCRNFRDGRVYLCPQMAYVNIFSTYFGVNIPLGSNDSVDLLNVGAWPDLLNALNMLHPDFCRTHCNNLGHDGLPTMRGVRRLTEKRIDEFCEVNGQ